MDWNVLASPSANVRTTNQRSPIASPFGSGWNGMMRIGRVLASSSGVGSPAGWALQVGGDTEIDWPKPIRIGWVLQQAPPGGVGAPRMPPGGYPLPPKRGFKPFQTEEWYREYWKELQTHADAVAAYWKLYYSFFDFFCSFTVDGAIIAHRVPINGAVNSIPEVESTVRAARTDGTGPVPIPGEHSSLQLSEAGLDQALDLHLGKEDSYWNDIHDLEISRKPGPAGTPPAPIPGDSPEEKTRKTLLKEAVEKQRVGKMVHRPLTIRGKPRR